MAYQIVPPPSHGTPDAVHKAFLSSGSWTGSATNGANQTHEGLRNPSVLPLEVLQKFHWIFLIRHPSCSIPSYYRTTIPPQTEITKFDYYDPAEAGYKELRLLFDYLRATGQVGPEIAGQETASGADGKHSQTSICLLDADDLLDKPALAIEQICKSVGIKFDPAMLKWDTPEDKTMASDLFSAWVGWHDDAIKSKGLQPRDHVSKFHAQADLDRSPGDSHRPNGRRLRNKKMRNGKKSMAKKPPRSSERPSMRISKTMLI